MYPFPEGTDPEEYAVKGRFPQLKGKHFHSGSNFLWVDSVVGGSIPGNFMPAVEKGFLERIKQGVIAGYPVQNVCVEVHFGKDHPVDSNETAFKIASSKVFSEVFQKARPSLLEPVVNLQITVPADNVGDVSSDLSGRRGQMVGMTSAGGGMTTVEAKAPLAEVATYARTLVQHDRRAGQLYDGFQPLRDRAAQRPAGDPDQSQKVGRRDLAHALVVATSIGVRPHSLLRRDFFGAFACLESTRLTIICRNAHLLGAKTRSARIPHSSPNRVCQQPREVAAPVRVRPPQIRMASWTIPKRPSRSRFPGTYRLRWGWFICSRCWRLSPGCSAGLAWCLILVGHLTFGMLGITIGYHRLLTHQGFTARNGLNDTGHHGHLLPAGFASSLGGRFIDNTISTRINSPIPIRPWSRFLWGHMGWLFVKNRDHRQGSTLNAMFATCCGTRSTCHSNGIRFGWASTACTRWRFCGRFCRRLLWPSEGMTPLMSGLQFGLSILVWGVFVRTVVVLHGTWAVNSFSHTFGYQNYQTGDSSRNNWLVALLSHGEGWHNNHHADQRAASHGHRWWELDMSWWIIRGLEWSGLIQGRGATAVLEAGAKTEAPAA